LRGVKAFEISARLTFGVRTFRMPVSFFLIYGVTRIS